MLSPSASCVALFAFFMQKIGNDQCSCFLPNLTTTAKAILISVVVFIHDNVRPHSAVVTQQLLQQFKWVVSDHPAYSPDLATSDFHLLPEVKNWLGGQSFQKVEDIQSKVKAHITPLLVTFFEEGIGNPFYRYDKCRHLHGDYVKK
ncbi:hypothetical protein AVEN_35542-1 [Araneus ventricosus]|uniref:Histone-lysine N-methyltransferase SETMAR n=1 Tax=Araneus ventricosus TaxID=182803 RepID=A0A4Y2HLI6_ARAVE|nr:hypothetical protein AVEN_35542-1 [Araneus ventricosus]